MNDTIVNNKNEKNQRIPKMVIDLKWVSFFLPLKLLIPYMLQTKPNKKKLLILWIKKFAYSFKIFFTNKIRISTFINNQKYIINVIFLPFPLIKQ